VWSLAWAVGPLVGAATLQHFGFTGLFLTAAAGLILVALPLLLLGPPRAAPPVAGDTVSDAVPSGRSMVVLVASFALFHTAMYAGSVCCPCTSPRHCIIRSATSVCS
jgi:SET family sugar efflux transporter-like MFS transporter